MNTTYQVVIKGLASGQSTNDVAEKLAPLFKVSVDEASQMLNEANLVVKKGIDFQAAVKYVEALESCGCDCEVKPEAPHLTEDAVVIDEQTPPPALNKVTESVKPIQEVSTPIQEETSESKQSLHATPSTDKFSRKKLAAIGISSMVAIVVTASVYIGSKKDSTGINPPQPVEQNAVEQQNQRVTEDTGNAERDHEELSTQSAFNILYGSYDEIRQGVWWTVKGSPTSDGNVTGKNGSKVFVKQYLLKTYEEGNVKKAILVTNSLEVGENGEPEKAGDGCHACGSIVGVALFHKQKNIWTLVSENKAADYQGSWGGPSEISVAFPANGGVELRVDGASMNQGISMQWAYKIMLDNNKWVVTEPLSSCPSDSQ